MGRRQLWFHYDEVCLWRLDPREQLARIRREALWSLLPLLSLMGEEGQPAVVEEAVRWARCIPDQEERSDVSVGLAILAGLRYTREWILRLIEEGQLMESSVVVYFTERAERRAKQEDILQVLGARLGAVPADLEHALRQVETMDVLNQLVRAAARCESLDAFRQALEELTGEE